MSRHPDLVTINFAAGEVALPTVVKLTDHRTGEVVKRHRDWVTKAVNKKAGGDYNKFVAEYTSRPRAANKSKAPVAVLAKPKRLSRTAARMLAIANG